MVSSVIIPSRRIGAPVDREVVVILKISLHMLLKYGRVLDFLKIYWVYPNSGGIGWPYIDILCILTDRFPMVFVQAGMVHCS